MKGTGGRPYGTGIGSLETRADVGIGPYGTGGRRSGRPTGYEFRTRNHTLCTVRKRAKGPAEVGRSFVYLFSLKTPAGSAVAR